MAGILFKNGKLVFAPSGAISFCKDDCTCDGRPCQDCCVRLVGGEYVPVDGSEPAHWFFRVDSEESDDWSELRIEGVGENRLICNEQEVTFTVTYKHDNAQGSNNGHGVSETDHRPRISWDRAWEYQSITPAPSDSDNVFPHGLIRFGDDEDVHEYEITMKFNACYVGSGTQYGEIVFDWFDDDITHTLALSDCPRTEEGECCTFDFDCEPCCYYVPITDGKSNLGGTEIVYWAEDQGLRVRLAFVIDPNERVVYCKDEGGSVQVKVDVIPPPNYNAGFEPKFCIFYNGWWKTDYPDGTGDPPCPPPSEADCDNEPWHTYGEGWSNTITFVTPPCDHPCAQDATNGLTLSLGLEGSAAEEITVETANLTECPGLCCCDQYVACCDTYCQHDLDTPVSPGYDDSYNTWTTEGPYTITDYKLTSVFANNTIVYEASQDARVYYDLIDVSLPGCPEELKPRVVEHNFANVFWLNEVKKDGAVIAPNGFITRFRTCQDDVILIEQEYPTGFFVPVISVDNICGGDYSYTIDDGLGGVHTVEFTIEGSTEYPFDHDDLRCTSGRLEINDGGTWRKVLQSEINEAEGEEF